MKIIKNSKEITTLEVGDKVIFGNLEYEVTERLGYKRYYLDSYRNTGLHPYNNKIFKILNLKKEDFIEKLGINARYEYAFPETYSLEALTAIVSALFKEYEKQNELPKTWEEFCVKHSLKENETYIDTTSRLISIGESIKRRVRLFDEDKNLCTSEQESEAFLALMQLRQLRKAYVKDWEPNWTKDTEIKYCIDFYNGQIRLANWGITSQVLSFPTFELAEQFLTNFKDLIEIAKPLL